MSLDMPGCATDQSYKETSNNKGHHILHFKEQIEAIQKAQNVLCVPYIPSLT